MIRPRPPYTRVIAAATAVTSAAVAADLFSESSRLRSSPMYHRIIDRAAVPLLKVVLPDAEDAHAFAVAAARRGVAPAYYPRDVTGVESTGPVDLMVVPFVRRRARGGEGGPRGPAFPCVGLAAGFDKDGEAVWGLLDAGFGSVEIGTVTPRPQPGNPRPRLFRLSEDRAVVNRYGFNSSGEAAVAKNLEEFRARERLAPRTDGGVLGINVGKNKLTSEADARDDYVSAIRALGPYADYIVVNVSSPNTPGLRDMQRRAPLMALVTAALDARDAATAMDRREGATRGAFRPVLVKISPDMSDTEMADAADVALRTGVDGVVVSNTTISRPESLVSSFREEKGGLSGTPLREASTRAVRHMYELTGGQVPIVGAGGISSGEDALEKIFAGASMVQIYTAMAFEGPGVATRVRHELEVALAKRGFKSVQEAVGYDHRRGSKKE